MTKTSHTAGRERSPGDRRRWLALYLVCVAQLMIVLDGTIVNVALPAIQGSLGFSQVREDPRSAALRPSRGSASRRISRATSLDTARNRRREAS